jgi:hypothetical protein
MLPFDDGSWNNELCFCEISERYIEPSEVLRLENPASSNIYRARNTNSHTQEL